ncbi:hypothetical protein EZS27_014794 [termite gut metagenome]|uniref:Uncharacterized protein n=1 Tax=termite gut metagenome TaxID=433724 RepID=A0A5J4RUJ2_9ZZZZ
MKTLTNKFYSLLLLLIVATTAFSQNYLKSPQALENELKSDLNVLFQDLDTSRITSGLLSNYALEYVEIAPFNGIPSDTNYVDGFTANSQLSQCSFNILFY